jgi:hypothetical protein
MKGDKRSTQPCERCGETMKLVRVEHKMFGLPELRTFRCETCSHVETKEHNEPPRVCRRLQLLRRWSHGQADKQQVFA